MPRGPKGSTALITPSVIESLLAEGLSPQAIADRFDVSREALYCKRKVNATFNAAFIEGQRRWREYGSKHLSSREHDFTLGDVIVHLLGDILAEVQSLHREAAS